MEESVSLLIQLRVLHRPPAASKDMCCASFMQQFTLPEQRPLFFTCLQSIIQGINGVLAPDTEVVQLLGNNQGGGRRHRRRQLLQSSRGRSTRQSKVR
jgi:hypothetical protein